MTKPNASALDQLTLDDVRAAYARIGDAVVRTPMLKSQTLSQIAGAEIWLKFENLQFTAAYKERGALNALLLMSEEARARGVIAASAGNHSQGLSYHGSRLGVPVTIVMPRTTPAVKVMQTEAVGGDVDEDGYINDCVQVSRSIGDYEAKFVEGEDDDGERREGDVDALLEGAGAFVTGCVVVAHAPTISPPRRTTYPLSPAPRKGGSCTGCTGMIEE